MPGLCWAMSSHELTGPMYTVTPSGPVDPLPKKAKPRVVDYLAGATPDQLSALPDPWRPPGIPHRHVAPYIPPLPEDEEQRLR
jgi:hypothetical protein